MAEHIHVDFVVLVGHVVFHHVHMLYMSALRFHLPDVMLAVYPVLTLPPTHPYTKQDVRDVVRSYDGEEDIAAAFKQRMAQLASQKKSGGRRARR